MESKYPKSAGLYEPAMTFEEIGKALGIRKQAAYFLYVSALKKLRHKPQMERIRDLAAFKDESRA